MQDVGPIVCMMHGRKERNAREKVYTDNGKHLRQTYYCLDKGRTIPNLASSGRRSNMAGCICGRGDKNTGDILNARTGCYYYRMVVYVIILCSCHNLHCAGNRGSIRQPFDRVSVARLGASLPNGTPGVVNKMHIQRLSCADKNDWAQFRMMFLRSLEKEISLGQDDALVDAAERLLRPFDARSREFFQASGSDFHAHLDGTSNDSASDGFCFPGYQAACLVRVAHFAVRASQATAEEASRLQLIVEENAQFCASIFGKEAVLEFMSSTNWPVRLVDLEMHMRMCPDAAFTSRLLDELPFGIDTYDQFQDYVRSPPIKARLHAGSIDPQRLSWLSPVLANRAGARGSTGWQQIVVVSVDGGHCSLWLEPAYTLRALFPDHVKPRLATYKGTTECLKLHGPGVFVGEDVFTKQQYWGGNPVLRDADVLVGQWIAECSKLRVEYSKPVIAYLGFLLLNDPAVGSYHSWSEPLSFYWERFKFLHSCDVHRKANSLSGPPDDGGPPCAVVYEEPQLAEAAFWQTGQRRPSIRPLSLYVRARHDPEQARNSVLIINRGRIVRDMLFGNAVRAMRHPRHPYDFVEQRSGMPFEEMASHRGAVLLPWDMNLVMFHDLYAMDLPLFLPDREGLHHVALSYFARFRKNAGFVGQPFGDSMPGRGIPAHAYSPFALDYLEARDYWLRFTEYLRAPSVAHFYSLPHLLLQVVELDGAVVARQMRAHNNRCFRQSKVFWERVLSEFRDGRPKLTHKSGEETPQVWHFKTPWVDELCWRQGMSSAYCCDLSHGPEGDESCFDDFWTFHRCCVHNISLYSLDDNTCSGSLPSPLDGVPWIQKQPSQQEPFIFLWDEKCGGTSFMGWLKYSVWKLDKLRTSFMYTTPGHPVPVGTPFFLKTFGERARSELEVVSGHFDWRLLNEGIGCATRRQVRCLLLVRHPLERFLSYYLERSDRKFARSLGNRNIERWSAAALKFYLNSIKRESMWYSGDETGIFCNRENLLCLDWDLTGNGTHPLMKRVQPRLAKERYYFRYLGGPQNRLTWLLDPDHGDPRMAIWRMRRCVVGLQTEDFLGFKRVLGWYFPWIHELQSHSREKRKKRHLPRAKALLRRLPLFAKRLIQEYNAADMKVYKAARSQFYQQLSHIRLATRNQSKTRWPPAVNISGYDVEAKVTSVLKDTATYRNHARLTEFMVR